MADKKKTTPLDVSKVKRGVKGALTPGEQPEKEKTPIEKVISRELTEIVKDSNLNYVENEVRTKGYKVVNKPHYYLKNIIG